MGNSQPNAVTFSTDNYSIYNGFEVSANARFSKGLLFGGVTTRADGDPPTATVKCRQPGTLRGTIQTPCASAITVRPFRTLAKGLGLLHDALRHPGEQLARIVAQGTGWQRTTRSLPQLPAGTIIRRSVRDAQPINVNLIEPNTLFLDRMKQLDAARSARRSASAASRTQGFVDVFNVLNAGTVTSVTRPTYGANPATRTWMNPASDSHRPHDPVRHAVGVLGEDARKQGYAEDAERRVRRAQKRSEVQARPAR